MKRNLSDEARLLRNQYIRNWRANHADKVRESNRLYWERRAERSISLTRMEAVPAKEDRKP